ncbi:DUF3592 domain-containing protein [Peteryoungia ipomoeae]|uniref:DUF3592 domain-containing protein n=1 Tax=Peteryoungia ipomoeae TaxID=1210932 RepID=A0A4S8PC07_9HYPH|nr:DUF3592 domain-containing protein [Peteryoungia ipomoeae]THV25689.1 hypothetical protein FAA97_05755 [Peteryoungia ipomoeae]
MKYEKRAKLASHAFALVLSTILIGLVLPVHIQNKRIAEQQLEHWTAAIAEVQNVEIKHRRGRRSCTYQILYTFVAEDGQVMRQRSHFPCQKTGWFEREAVPMAKRIDVLYDTADPTRSRPLVLIKKDQAFQFHYLALVGIVLWTALYVIGRKIIRFAIKLP